MGLVHAVGAEPDEALRGPLMKQYWHYCSSVQSIRRGERRGRTHRAGVVSPES
jgi:hypothetical protein